MAEPPLAVFQEAHRDLSGAKPHLNRFQHHLRCIFPRLRLQSHPFQGVLRDSTHAAMDIREMARKDKVEDPGSDWRAEVLMKWRHGARLAASLPSRAHQVLVPLPEPIEKKRDVAKVV